MAGYSCCFVASFIMDPCVVRCFWHKKWLFRTNPVDLGNLRIRILKTNV